MIDFIHVLVRQTDVELSISHLDLDFNATVNEKTGELLPFKVAEYGPLKVKMVGKERLTIYGSLHKYWNWITTGRMRNDNFFSFNHAVFAIRQLTSEFGIPASEMAILTAEFGFNLDVNFDIDKFIQSELIAYGYSTHSTNKNLSYGGMIKKFERCENIIKIYNKSHDIGNKQIIRIEIKTLRSRVLRRYKVYLLSDLLQMDKWEIIFKYVMKHLNELRIVDNITDNLDESSHSDNEYYLKIINSQYWVGLGTMSSKDKAKHRRTYNKFIDKFNITNRKIYIFTKIRNEFQNMMRTFDFIEEYSVRSSTLNIRGTTNNYISSSMNIT